LVACFCGQQLIPKLGAIGSSLGFSGPLHLYPHPDEGFGLVGRALAKGLVGAKQGLCATSLPEVRAALEEALSLLDHRRKGNADARWHWMALRATLDHGGLCQHPA